MNFFFQSLYLKSNFALTLGYLNPALNNPVPGFGIQNLAEGIQIHAKNYNPEFKCYRQGIQNPVAGIQNS